MKYDLQFPCCLPVDPLGIPYGPEYFTKVQAGRSSTFTTDYMFSSGKNGCIIQCLGMGEIYMARLLEISPFVLAYRCQYPMLLSSARGRIDDYVSGIVDTRPEIRQSDLISLDVLVTARPDVTRQSGLALESPKYFVLSHKLKEEMKSKKVKNRLKIERSEAELFKFEYLVFSRNGLLDECGKSARQISLWGKGVDFNAGFMVACELGKIFYKTYDGGPLDRYLIRVSDYLKITIDQGYQYFSAAVNFGFLYVDLSFPVRRQYSLHLIQPAEAVPPWISFSGKVNSSSER